MIEPMKNILLVLLMVCAAPVFAQMVPAIEGATQTMTPTAVLGLVATGLATTGPAATGLSAPTTEAAPKKPGLPLAYFAVGAGTALAGNGFGTEGNPWIDTNTDTIANGYGVSFNPGESIVALFGFNLDKNWSLGLSLESYSFITLLSSASNEESVIPFVRYTVGSGWISPYVSAGLGFNFNTTSAAAPASVLNNAQVLYNTQVDSNMVASGGVGLLFKIGGDIGHAYIAAQYQQVFNAQGGFSYYPVNVGVQYP